MFPLLIYNANHFKHHFSMISIRFHHIQFLFWNVWLSALYSASGGNKSSFVLFLNVPKRDLTCSNARSRREFSGSSLKTERCALSVELRAFHSENRSLVPIVWYPRQALLKSQKNCELRTALRQAVWLLTTASKRHACTRWAQHTYGPNTRKDPAHIRAQHT